MTTGVRMQKVILVMWRRPELTREEFARHYLDVHSVLARQHVTMLDGYTVNVPDASATATDDDDGPDGVIEIWTHDADALFDPERGFTSRADFEEVMRDDASFIGTTAIWEVQPGDAPLPEHDTPLRERTPGIKRITLLEPGAVADDGATGAVVDRVVAARPARRPPPAEYEVGAFVHEWAERVDDLAPVTSPSFAVSEYRQRLLPAP